MTKSLSFERHFWGFLLLILLFGFTAKTVRLGFPPTMYFDEIYHAFTAQRIIDNDPGVYDAFVKHPEGFAYEWTHPPLGKLFMVVSIFVWGDNAFGWRFSSVVFGTLFIFLSALLALQLFQSRKIALLTAFFLTIEGMLFAHSRIAMIDLHFLSFALLTLIIYWKWKKDPGNLKLFLLMGVGAGLSLATKWTTLYLYIVIAVDFMISFIAGMRPPRKNWFFWILLTFGVIPFFIYLSSYAQMFFQGYGMGDFVELQRQMWGYHSNLKDTHSYSSTPFQWIFNLRPVFFYYHYNNNWYGYIYNLGNSVILWSGFFIFLATIRLLVKKWEPELGFVTVAYFLFWFPWMFSPRIQFFHHYSTALPFLCMLMSHFLLTRKPKEGPHYLFINILTCAIFWFILFFPHTTAIQLPKWFVDVVYFALPGWE